MPKTETIQYTNSEPQRLDTFLASQFSTYSRSYWTNMIQHNFVKVNEKSTKVGKKLRSNDKVEITWPDVRMEFSDAIIIIYENDDLVVFDKPAGMLTHSKGAFNPEYTVANWLQDKFKLQGFEEATDRNGVVHRLDRQTSGIMVGAKTSTSQAHLQKQFAERKVTKYYVAVVEGKFEKEYLEIDIPIARSKSNPKTFSADADGKEARTAIHRISVNDDENFSVVLLKPETGRTHQLRVHLNYLGYPIIGDLAYGSSKTIENDRFLLHALCIKLTLMSKEPGNWSTQIPKDMTPYLDESDFKKIDKLTV